MLEFLHNANDWLGSLLLFLFLVVAWLMIIVLIVDEFIGLILPEEDNKKENLNEDD